jgi:hypothetical protein
MISRREKLIYCNTHLLSEKLNEIFEVDQGTKNSRRAKEKEGPLTFHFSNCQFVANGVKNSYDFDLTQSGLNYKINCQTCTETTLIFAIISMPQFYKTSSLDIQIIFFPLSKFV